MKEPQNRKEPSRVDWGACHGDLIGPYIRTLVVVMIMMRRKRNDDENGAE